MGATKKYIKDYLNSNESLQYFMMCHLLENSRVIFENWNLTPGESKFIKYINTYTSKFCAEVLKRLKKEQVDKLFKWSKQFELYMADSKTQKDIEKQAAEKQKWLKINRKDFEDWTSEIMAVKCENCKKHWVDCDLHRLFLDSAIPESQHDLENCRYAYLKIGKKVI